MSSVFREINFIYIARIIGLLLMIEGAFMFTGIPVAWYYCGFECNNLLIPAIVTFFSGAFMYALNGTSKTTLNKRDGYIIVTFSWLFMAFFGALPYYLSGIIPSFTDSFFESMSGFTTTGSSILTDIQSMPKDIVYWRSLTHWMGGMGIIVLSVAVLPMLGIGGMQLFMAEMPGVTYDKMHPRITATAKRLWMIYVLLTIAAFLLLWADEMDWFDAMCHSFATIATGGFSTQNNSIAGYGAYTQYVIIGFMFLSGTNFILHYFALHGQLKRVYRDEEFRWYISIIVISAAIIGTGLYLNNYATAETSFRDALFSVVSILTTTGFSSSDYLQWPAYLLMIVFLLMFAGSSVGSTGSGIKIIRHLLLYKNAWMELRRAVHPQAILPVKFNQKSVPEDIIYKVIAFFLMYLIIMAFGVLFLSALGIDFNTAIGASIASIGNIGIGIGTVGPIQNYALFSDAAKWFLSAMMLIGRLELFVVLMLFSPHFWKK